MLGLAYVLDIVAGGARMPVKDLASFFTSPILVSYPLTGASIIIRTLAIFIGYILMFSLLEKKYFTKAAVTLFLAVVAEFYSIQQMTTGIRTTPIQWTLAFAYCGVLFGLLFAFYFLKGVVNFFHQKLSNNPEKTQTHPQQKQEPVDDIPF